MPHYSLQVVLEGGIMVPGGSWFLVPFIFPRGGKAPLDNKRAVGVQRNRYSMPKTTKGGSDSKERPVACEDEGSDRLGSKYICALV